MTIALITINKLRQHEQVNKMYIKVLKKKIQKSGVFKEPIIVDKDYFVVLDGHHRLNSCIELGFKKIPCLLVDYINNPKIKVVSRRDEYQINKDIVIKMGLSNAVFPLKTTKHFIPNRKKQLKIPLQKLIA